MKVAMIIMMIIMTKMTKKTYNYCEVWVKKCYFKDKYLVKKKGPERKRFFYWCLPLVAQLTITDKLRNLNQDIEE